MLPKPFPHRSGLGLVLRFPGLLQTLVSQGKGSLRTETRHLWSNCRKPISGQRLGLRRQPCSPHRLSLQAPRDHRSSLCRRVFCWRTRQQFHSWTLVRQASHPEERPHLPCRRRPPLVAPVHDVKEGKQKEYLALVLIDNHSILRG